MTGGSPATANRRQVAAAIDFWFDPASSYSYPAAMTIDAEAAKARVSVRWRPFLLGPVFKSLGWAATPFEAQPLKGAYMWRDLERIAADLGLPFRQPKTFPLHSLLAARLVLVGLEAGWGVDFAKAAYRAAFGEGRDIGDRVVIADILTSVGREPAAEIRRAEAGETKARLRAETDEAARIGIFGAPTFVTAGGDVFWGHDRMEQALRWAVSEARQL